MLEKSNEKLKEEKIPNFEIHLETEPKKRFIPVVRKFKQYFGDLKKALTIEENFYFGCFSPFSQQFKSFARIARVPKTYKLELEGMASFTKDYGITYEDLLFLNIGLSFTGGCTSAVKNGYHFRNMDWNIDILRKMTCNITFFKNKKKLYKITTWCCMIGALTGMRFNGWSVSLNYRRPAKELHCYLPPEIETIGKNTILAIFQVWPIEFLIREQLETQQTYGKALKVLKSTKLMCPCYLILCGLKENEKIVIERNRFNTKKVICSNDYVCKTNTDECTRKIDKKWARGDYLLLNSIERQEKAKEILKKMVIKGDNFKGMKMLKTYPLFNDQTCYSTVMSPKINFYESISFQKTKKEEEKKNL